MTDMDKVLALFEARFQAFGVRLANYDGILKNLSSHDERLASLEKTVPAHAALLQAVVTQVTKSDSDHSKFSSYLDSKLSGHIQSSAADYSSLSKRTENLERFKNEHYVLAGKQTISEEKIQALHAAKEAQSRRIDSLASSVDANATLVSNSSADISSLREKLKSLAGPITTLNSFNERLSAQIHELKGSFSSALNKVNDQMESRKSETSSSLKSLNESFDKKLAQIQVPDVSGFVKKDEVESLKHSINLSALDAKNAIAKSNNNEMQNQITSKKLDGVLIQLKAQEYAPK